MQYTENYHLKKPQMSDFASIEDISENMDTIDEKLAAPTGDARDQVVSFTDADLDTGITSFPTFLTKIVSGMKLAKFLRDFKAGMGYVLHTGSLINNATCTEAGKALDARMGKTLQDQITSLNDSLTSINDYQDSAFHNNWTSNGICYRHTSGIEKHIHLSLRSGTRADGTEIMSGLGNAKACSGPLFNRETRSVGFWVADTTGSLKIYNVDSNNIMLDVFYY